MSEESTIESSVPVEQQYHEESETNETEQQGTDNEQPEQPEQAESEQESEDGQEQRKKRDYNARVRQLLSENKELETRLAALEEQNKPKTTQQQELKRPNPADYVGGKFNDDYDRDLQAFNEAATTLRIQQAIEQYAQLNEATKTVASIQQREDAFRTTHADYDDAVNSVIDAGIISNREIYDAITSLDNSPELVYKIGNDDALLETLSKMNPIQRIMKIGAIAESLNNTGKVKPISNAPKPITPVSSGVSPALNREEAMDAAMKARDFEAYKRARLAK
jgi:hypothetical protein